MHYSDNDCHNGEICDQFKLLFNAFQMDFGEKIHAMWQSNSQGSLSLPNEKVKIKTELRMVTDFLRNRLRVSLP